MNISRRNVFKTGALVSVGIGLGSFGIWRSRPAVAMLSAVSDTRGNHFGAVLSESGEIITRVPLPKRSHAAIYNHHKDEALFFSRRPGRQLFLFARESTQLTHIISAAPGRHFYGHGVLVDDGKVLLATENNYQTGAGVVTLRDVLNQYRVIDEISSHGVGPHELVVFPDNTRIAIANGGLLTHPDKNRVPLNIESMQPNVSVVDWQSGKLLQQYKPPDNRLSLRHLSVNGENKIFVGAQLQGAEVTDMPLVMRIESNRRLRQMQAPTGFSLRQNYYTASVCCVKSNTENHVVVSFPKGGQLTIWDNQQLTSHISRRDIAGVCQLKNGAVVFSTGAGEIGQLNLSDASATTLQHYRNLRWDNHLISV